MFLAFLLGCSTLAGAWSGVWVCSDQMFEEAEASEFDVDLELLAVSKYGFEGTLTMEGEVMIEDDEGDTNSWTWWSESAVRMEMTEFGGPQPLKVDWEDGECSLTRGSEEGTAICDDEYEDMEGWEWTEENAIYVNTGICSGLLER